MNILSDKRRHMADSYVEVVTSDAIANGNEMFIDIWTRMHRQCKLIDTDIAFLSTITELSLWHKFCGNLELTLQFMTNLKSLYVSAGKRNPREYGYGMLMDVGNTGFGSLINLESLYISTSGNFQLDTSGVGRIPNLQSLEITASTVNFSIGECFSGCDNISSLTNLSISTLWGGRGYVTDITKLSNLTRLYLSGNLCTPRKLGLRKLREAEFRDCRVPDDIGELISLQELSIYNANKSMRDLGIYARYHDFNCSGVYDGFNDYRPHFGFSDLTDLRSLTLSGNVVIPPNSFKKLTKLTKLHQFCHHDGILDEIHGATNLTNLEISFADRADIDLNKISHLTSLTALRVRNIESYHFMHKISEDSLRGLRTLRELRDLRMQCVFTTLPRELHKLRKLSSVDLIMETIPEWFGTFTELSSVKINCQDFNKMNELKKNFRQLMVVTPVPELFGYYPTALQDEITTVVECIRVGKDEFRLPNELAAIIVRYLV